MDPDRDRVEEARADEEAALHARRRGRSLADYLGDAMAAGDRVEARCGPHAVDGAVVAARGDHAVLVHAGGRSVLHLGGPITLHRSPSARGGTRGDRSHDSFAARVATLGLLAEAVEVVETGGTTVGVVLAVAVDHVLVATERGDAALPLAGIGWVTGSDGGGTAG